jgi:hypothetical protein
MAIEPGEKTDDRYVRAAGRTGISLFSKADIFLLSCSQLEDEDRAFGAQPRSLQLAAISWI